MRIIKRFIPLRPGGRELSAAFEGKGNLRKERMEWQTREPKRSGKETSAKQKAFHLDPPLRRADSEREKKGERRHAGNIQACKEPI